MLSRELSDHRQTDAGSRHVPTGGAALSSPATATLSIDSDDTTNQPITSTFQQGVNGYAGTTDADISNQYGGNGSTTVEVTVPNKPSPRPDGRHFFYAIVYAGKPDFPARAWTGPLLTTPGSLLYS